MERRFSGLLLLAATLTACNGDRAAARCDAAIRAFESFQQALQQRDERACRELLTAESRAVLEQLPWDRVANRHPLQVLGAVQDDWRFHVRVLDPNENGARGEFVVVRERGRLVVDLVASAAVAARPVERSGGAVEASAQPSEQYEPGELTPADLDRIHAYELSQPPR
ncbi:MAG: hypothetical protein H6835_10425 [Planctomycetes bacterium]|nr:hypothetical protein [Planctomycetota bacterium]